MNEQHGLPTRITLISATDLLEFLWPDPTKRPSLRWLRGLQAARKIPYVKIGSRVFFNPDEVLEWVEKKTINPRN